MKRHEALHPLSRDHHNVLVHARRLRGLDARVDAATAQRRFLSYFHGVLSLHFGEEEAILAPRVQDLALKQRLVDEHADLGRRTAELEQTGQGQAELGEALRLHVRFEEDELFPHLEGRLTLADWATVAKETARFRQGRRPDSIAGDEACFL